MPAPYPYINGTQLGNNLPYIFTYLNDVTSGGFGGFVFWMVAGFFIIVFLASMIAQKRINGRIRPEQSFAASSFATLGFGIILASANVIGAFYIIVILALNIISIIWLVLGRED